MKLCLELARVAGTGTRQETIESDCLEYLRLPADCSEKMTLKRIQSFCREAYSSQSLYTRISMKQWFRTAVKSRSMIERMMNHRLEIHNNVVPQLRYLKRLEVEIATCCRQGCSGGFLPTSVLRAGEPLRQPCKNCALAEQLMRIETDSMAGDELDTLPELSEDDLKPMKHIGGGSEGDISTMLWRRGTVFVRKRFNSSEGRNPNFDRELEVAKRVSHPNIVHCFGRSRSDSTNFDLFMEFLEEDLESFLNEGARLESGPPFSFRDVLDVLLQIAEAMKQLHEKRFIHGDLKPGNILVSKLAMPHSNIPFYLIKVADFGCAQHVDSVPFDFGIGTLQYTAPEVLRIRNKEGAQPDNLQKIDVYSFGVVAYQILSGLTTSLLYEDMSVSEIKAGVTREDTDEFQLRPNQVWNSGTPELVNLEPDRSTLLPLIRMCWASSPQLRPTFPVICDKIQELYDRAPSKRI